MHASIIELAPHGLQVNLWPCDRGFQANVKERAGNGYTVVVDADPIYALTEALRQRAAGVQTRRTVASPPQADDVVDPAEGAQLDIEDAIAAVAVDDFEGLL